MNAVVCAPTNAGRRKSVRSTIPLRSTAWDATNAISSSAATVSRETMNTLDQPCWLPSISPSTSASRPPVRVTRPTGSRWLWSGSLDSRSCFADSTTAAIPIGMLTRKIHRHESHDVSRPPASGPIATAAPTVAPHTPNAVPRSRPWNSCESSASAVANMIAPPMP